MALTAESHALITHGPLVQVALRPHPTVDVSDAVATWGEKPSVKVTLLVDTGARFSMIDRQIVEDLKITPMNYLGDIITAAGVLHEQPIYLVEMVMTLNNGTISLPTAVIGLPTGPLLTQSRYQGILARDWLQKTHFTYNGAAGKFTIDAVRK